MLTWAESLIATGGLMRCCIDTIVKAVEDNPETPCVEGQRLQCRYTEEPSHGMVMELHANVKNPARQIGIWKWDHS